MFERNRIYTGDCLDVMSKWPENIIDTIITDPPYGLSFMGKDWDHGIPGQHFWTEMLRICKPGAMLLAFGGTRTYHRLAVAIEDAGWEIRDCLMWLYSTGFPKSLNFGCRCKEGKHENTSRMPDVQQDVFQTRVLGKAGEESLLQLPMQREGKIKEPNSLFGEHEGQEGAAVFRPTESILERRQLHRATEGLPNDASAESPSGQGERVRARTSHRDGVDHRTLSDADGGSSSHRRQSSQQPSIEPETVRESLRPLDDRALSDDTCQTCGGLKAWKGFGTALKPAWEPIILAMKPCEGTFAENAEKWGIAGLNVDGGRIASCAESFTDNRPDKIQQNAYGKYGPADYDGSKGRWPANLILDEEAAGMLDGVSGQRKVAPHGPNVTAGASLFGIGQGGGACYSDSGGASRFFYVAKSGRAERNEGCEEMEAKPNNTYGDFQGTPEHRPKINADLAKGNHHPTVKPLELMKYLCMLTKTPTGGIVLDPFCGSGTTLWAAEFHNRPWIGIEMNPEYVAIAEARIARERSQIKMAI